MRLKVIVGVLGVLSLACVGLAQTAPVTQAAPLVPAATAPAPDPNGYILGPDDMLSIRGVDIDEFADKPIQVGQDGVVALPMVGRMKASGLTVRQFETELRQKLRAVIKDPQISVTVTDFRSQPVSVLGAVNSSGVHQLKGDRSLTEVLSLAGGTRTDAGYKIKIVRPKTSGPIPLGSAHPDETGNYSVAEVNLKDILDARKPEENIRILPHDVVTVPRAEMVYVVGQVNRSGGFVLNDNASMSVIQALAMAGGLSAGAGPKNARVLRPGGPNGTKTEMAINVKKVMEGKAPDFPMQPDDILFIPTNAARNAGIRAAEAAINVGTGLVIWRL